RFVDCVTRRSNAYRVVLRSARGLDVRWKRHLTRSPFPSGTSIQTRARVREWKDYPGDTGSWSQRNWIADRQFNGYRLQQKPATKGDNMPRSKVNAWYGWVPDRPDYRDKLYSAIAAPPKKLPSKVDLREGCSRVEDQGQLGSCTANALVGNLEFLRKKAGHRVSNLSRLFIYYNERDMERTINDDD